MLAADREFAALAAEAGLRVALERFLAADAVLFRPLPVRGRDWLDANEPPSGRLDWQPAVVELACDSSLAVTFGTWRYLPLDGPLSGEGVYLTVWRRVAGGDWRIVLDQSLGTDALPARIALEPGRTCTTSQEAAAELLRADARSNGATRSLAGAPAPRGGLRGVPQGQVLGDAGADLALTYGEFVTRKPPRGQAPARLRDVRARLAAAGTGRLARGARVRDAAGPLSPGLRRRPTPARPRSRRRRNPRRAAAARCARRATAPACWAAARPPA